MPKKTKDDSKLEQKLNNLVKEFGTDLQQKKPEVLIKHASDSHRRLQQSVDKLQDLLDFLRICIKYQIFDLEATRRENRYLRKMLEEREG